MKIITFWLLISTAVVNIIEGQLILAIILVALAVFIGREILK